MTFVPHFVEFSYLIYTTYFHRLTIYSMMKSSRFWMNDMGILYLSERANPLFSKIFISRINFKK